MLNPPLKNSLGFGRATIYILFLLDMYESEEFLLNFNYRDT